MPKGVDSDGADSHGPYCRFCSGEVEALVEIWNRHREPMRRIAAGYMQGWQQLGGLFEPDDFVQETFRRLIESPIRRAFATRCVRECEREFWRIFRTVLHQAIVEESDRLCALKRGGDGVRKPDDGEHGRSLDGDRRWIGIAIDEAKPIASNRPGPETLVAGQDLVDRFLKQLDDEGAAIVRMRLDGHTIPEIAAATGQSPRSIARRLNEIRRLCNNSVRID